MPGIAVKVQGSSVIYGKRISLYSLQDLGSPLSFVSKVRTVLCCDYPIVQASLF